MRALPPDLGIVLDPGLTTFFLGRLEQLVLRQALAPSARERTALAQLAFALFLDCLDLGIGTEARGILASLYVEPTAARVVA